MRHGASVVRDEHDVREVDVWSPPPPGQDAAGQYLCVLGNTAAGKSTLVHRLVTCVDGVRPTIGIDERSTHHPYLDRLFHEPRRYGLELQLNFMLQRVLIVRRWLDAGHNVIMERSHLDDIIFARHLARRGLINDAEQDAYLLTHSALDRRAQLPDRIIALDLPGEVCLRHLNDAENAGHRPREFPDEGTKRDWVMSWADLYSERFRELEANPRYEQRFVVLDEPATGRDAANIVDMLSTT